MPEHLTLEVHRAAPLGDAVPGTLSVNGVFQCYTLEVEEDMIPPGTYPVTITRSQRFQRMLPLLTVPERSGIRIHAGNTTADSTGCILVGKVRRGATLQFSRSALEALQPRLAQTLVHGGRISLTVHPSA